MSEEEGNDLLALEWMPLLKRVSNQRKIFSSQKKLNEEERGSLMRLNSGRLERCEVIGRVGGASKPQFDFEILERLFWSTAELSEIEMRCFRTRSSALLISPISPRGGGGGGRKRAAREQKAGGQFAQSPRRPRPRPPATAPVRSAAHPILARGRRRWQHNKHGIARARTGLARPQKGSEGTWQPKRTPELRCERPRK